MRLARKRIGMFNKLVKRVKHLDYKIENNIDKEKAEIERQQLANFILFYNSFKPFEELMCCKYKGFYIPFSKYMDLVIQGYEKDFEESCDEIKHIFKTKEEYSLYAFKSSFKCEPSDVLMLRPNLEVI